MQARQRKLCIERDPISGWASMKFLENTDQRIEEMQSVAHIECQERYQLVAWNGQMVSELLAMICAYSVRSGR